MGTDEWFIDSISLVGVGEYGHKLSLAWWRWWWSPVGIQTALPSLDSPRIVAA